jgi:hypothetical protein
MQAMKSKTPKSDVLTALRVIFELGARDIKANEAVLSDCLSVRGARLRALLVALQHHGLVQRGRVRLTMAGLVVAAGLPPVLADNLEDPIVIAA